MPRFRLSLGEVSSLVNKPLQISPGEAVKGNGTQVDNDLIYILPKQLWKLVVFMVLALMFLEISACGTTLHSSSA